jgi:O-antigen ligase
VNTHREASATVFWVAVIVCAGAFFITGSDLRASIFHMDSSVDLEPDQTPEELAEKGDTSRRVAFASLALLGVVFLVLPTGRQPRLNGLFPAVMIALLLWCVATFAWSISPSLTARRLSVAAFCLLAALGLARQLSARQLCLLTLAVTAGTLGVGVLAELALGTLRPWTSGYQFCGTMHPNQQGTSCALMGLAALCLAGSAKSPEREWYWTLFGVAVAFLLLTVSRTSNGAFFTVLVVMVLPRVPSVLLAGGAFAVACVVTVAMVTQPLMDWREVNELLLMGRSEHAGSLSGRVPLWGMLLTDYFPRHPLEGYGFGAFWNPTHLNEFASTLYWDIPDAHSMYLDTLINVGLVGATLFALGLLLGIHRAFVSYRATGDPGHRFLFALLIYALVEGFSESGFIIPTIYAFVAGCGLLHLGVFPDPGSETASPELAGAP